MQLKIDQLVQKLKDGQISLQEILSIRRENRAPFRLHPLGFLVCTLLEEGKHKIRLHLWPIEDNELQSPECRIHDHSFNFTSWVFCGSVENIEYSNSSVGKEYSVYQTNYNGCESILKKSNATCKVEVQKRHKFGRGTYYEVKTNTLHETVKVGKNPAFTVLETNDVSETSPLVLGPLNGQDQYTYMRKVIDDNIVEVMLDQVLSFIAAEEKASPQP